MIYKTWADADNDGAIWNKAVYLIQVANNSELPQRAIELSGGNDFNAVLFAEGDNMNSVIITDEAEAKAEFEALTSRMVTPSSVQGNAGKIYRYSSVILSKQNVEYGEATDTEIIVVSYKVSK